MKIGDGQLKRADRGCYEGAIHCQQGLTFAFLAMIPPRTVSGNVTKAQSTMMRKIVPKGSACVLR